MHSSFSCPAFNEHRCGSCSSLADPAELYLKKFLILKNSLQSHFPAALCLEPELLPNAFKSRAKAKLQVGGSVFNPEIGLDKKAESSFYISPLLDCPLHTARINPVLVGVKEQIKKYDLVPYSIEKRAGELKGLIILETSSGLGVRFVARSRKLESSFRKAAEDLVSQISDIKSVSLNIQPIPHQIVEGEEEILLVGDSFLVQSYGDFFVHLPPLSFVQVTPWIAERLYKAARDWLADKTDRHTLDLFCGAGGFLLSVASLCKVGTGIELRANSVKCANEAANLQGYNHLRFIKGDLNSVKILESFDTVIVNPPRRGLGKELIGGLKKMQPKQILYSSCNSETLVSDIYDLGYSPVKFKGFDMFPLTNHLEVLSLLER